MKNCIINCLVFAFSIVLAFLLAEGIAQLYVSKIALQGKLFVPDTTVGWKVKPNLNIQRKNSDGQIWHIATDTHGLRTLPENNHSKNKAVILGDSFAFGEGINIEHRFDTEIAKLGYDVINTGVMGYGTDQQFLLAQPWLSKLKTGDIVILLTYYNDFFDLARKTHSGRKKPWYQLQQGRLQLNIPEITFKEILRDKSYIYTKLASLLEHNIEAPEYDIDQSKSIFYALVKKPDAQIENKKCPRFSVLSRHGTHTKPAAKNSN